MPITYAQPEPFSPSVASAYGAAQQFSQDAPTIAGLAEHTASLQQQGLGRADQLRFAYAQANAQAREQDANRYAASEAHQADREQSGMNLGAQLEAQATGQMLHANTQLLAQQQGAQLQAWLGQQDLSQKEAMRLNQIHNTVGDIDAAEAAGKMPPDAAQEARFKAMGIASPLEQRLKAQQERALKASTDLHEQQTKLEAQKVEEMAKVNAMTAEQRVFTQLTPEAQNEIDSQNLTPMERDAAIKAAKAAGKYNTFTIGPTGELKHVDTKATHTDFEQKRYDAETKFFTQEATRWEQDYTKAQDRVRKHLIDAQPEDTKKTFQPDLEEIQKLALKEMRPRPTMPAPMQSLGARGQQPPPPTPDPTTTEQPKSAVAVLDNTLADFNQRPVAPEVKLEVNTMIEKAKSMIAGAKGYKNLSDADKKIYDEYQERVRQAIANAPPVQQQAPPPSPAPGLIGGIPQGVRNSNPFSRGPLSRLFGR